MAGSEKRRIGEQTMGVYLTINYRREAIRRLQRIPEITERLIDINAELDEIAKRDPLGSTHGSGDVKAGINLGGCKTPPGLALSSREMMLSEEKAELDIIVNDYKRGELLLSEVEKRYTELRFFKGYSQRAAALELDYSERQVRRFETEIIDVMADAISRVRCPLYGQ